MNFTLKRIERIKAHNSNLHFSARGDWLNFIVLIELPYQILPGSGFYNPYYLKPSAKMREWCDECIGKGRYRVHLGNGKNIRFYLRNESDVTLFKMVWS